MKPLLWAALVALLATGLSSAFFFVLYLASNEPVPLQRARRLWRWTVVVFLIGFNGLIYSQVVAGLRAVL